MQVLFCERCKSLVPPGATRCRQCGASMDGAPLSNQTCITDAAPRKRATPQVVRESNSEAPYLPYEPRGCQLDIINDAVNALDEGRHFVMESGTGTGKTIVALAAALQHRGTDRERKILYLTRTISQSDQVMRELRAISKIERVSGITITGRNKSCPLFRNTPGYEALPPNVLSMMCEDRRSRSVKGQAGGCRYFDRIMSVVDQVEGYCREMFPTSEELDRHCESLGACPYECKKALMKKMDVIVAPYVHVLSPEIRSNLLNNMGCGDDVLMIVDEAHNLVDAARDQESFVIDSKLVDRAVDECTTLRHADVMEGVHLSAFFRHFKACMRMVATEHMGLGAKEYLFDGDFIEEKMMSQFNLSRTDLDTVVSTALDIGTARTEALLQKGENRISDIEQLADSMGKWFSSSSGRFVRTMKIGDEGEFLSATCIDPAEISFFLRSLRGAIHMSGTLQPLDQYARVLGLPDNSRFRTYPSPFPPENRSVVYVRDLTTRQKDMKADPTMQTRMEKAIVNLCNSVDRNTLVFFTSYSNMRSMRPYIERHVMKDMYWEEQRNLRMTMERLTRFRNGRNGVFFSVMGGSVAEGIDFPGDELCYAIIVGIPYPPPTTEMRAMSDMYDQRYGPGKGWLYTSEVPALRKMKQAIGRLIRTETDRGMAVILDNRASKYVRQLGASASDDPAGDAARFFR